VTKVVKVFRVVGTVWNSRVICRTERKGKVCRRNV